MCWARDVGPAVRLDKTEEEFPALRNTGQCPKCGCGVVLLVRSVASVGDNVAQARLALLFNRYLGRTAAGDLAAYCCRGCGYVEHYVRDPATIPVDGENVVELVRPPTAPYR